MKRDAEAHADEDEKRRSDAEAKNEADAAVFGAEKLMGDLGDKMSPEEKGRVNTKLDALKKAIESGDTAAMKSAKDDLNRTMQEFGARLYQQAGPNPQQGGQQAGSQQNTHANDSDTVDAEFTDK